MYKKIGNLGPHSDFISTFRGSGRFSGGKTVRKNRVRLVWHAIPPEACPPARAFPHAPCSPPPLGSSCGPVLPARLRSGLLAARPFQPASARVFLRPGPSCPPGPQRPLLPDQPLASEREITVPRKDKVIQQPDVEQRRRFGDAFGQQFVLRTRLGSSRRMVVNQDELCGEQLQRPFHDQPVVDDRSRPAGVR